VRQYGAELIEFSPIADPALPVGLDAIYLGGGYPELHAETLAANVAMRESLARAVAGELPVYAECGGFMYLTEAIVDAEGRCWPMTGIFPTTARMQARRAKLGYIEVETAEAGWMPSSVRARGHEFRYSAIDAMPETISRCYHGPAEGFQAHAAVGSYVHLHFLSCPQLAEAFVEAARQYRESKELS
jgi:cobyrinic acid a,c-diamide synthase